MNDFVTDLINLLRLRSGPQNLPTSWPLTIGALLVYLGGGVLTSQHLGAEDSPGRIILSIVIQIIALAVILKVRRFPERFQQTLLALATTGFILGMLFFVVRLQNDPDIQVQPFWAMIVILLFFYNIAVDSNIYRHAFAISFPSGILVTVAIFAVTYIADYLMFFPA